MEGVSALVGSVEASCQRTRLFLTLELMSSTVATVSVTPGALGLQRLALCSFTMALSLTPAAFGIHVAELPQFSFQCSTAASPGDLCLGDL